MKLSLLFAVTPEGGSSYEVDRENLDETRVTWFLEMLMKVIPGRLLVVWDNGGSPARCSCRRSCG